MEGGHHDEKGLYLFFRHLAARKSGTLSWRGVICSILVRLSVHTNSQTDWVDRFQEKLSGSLMHSLETTLKLKPSSFLFSINVWTLSTTFWKFSALNMVSQDWRHPPNFALPPWSDHLSSSNDATWWCRVAVTDVKMMSQWCHKLWSSWHHHVITSSRVSSRVSRTFWGNGLWRP